MAVSTHPSITPATCTPARSLSIESLESRLNLSTLTGLGAPLKPESMPLTRMVSTHRMATSAAPAAANRAATGSSAPITIGADSWIAPGAYTAISNSKLENRRFGQDIGYVSRSGAYVEYTLNVTTPGTYTLNVGVACQDNATFSASIDGATIATFNTKSTGAWDNIVYIAQNVTLSAGTQTIRFTALNKTQYNLNSFEFRYQGDSTTTTTSATTTTGPTLASVTASSADTTAPIFPASVNVSQRSMTSFNELDITGITSNASIYVTQAGNTFTITSSDATQQITGNFGTIVISAGDGAANVTVDSSVTLPTTVYSGTGNDTIDDATQGQAVIVTLDGGADTVTGNGVNTAFWVTSSDTVNATAAEKANGDVHVVSSVYQPKGAGTVTNVRDGMNITDPTASTSTTTRLTSSSFFGTGPVATDVNQGQSSDCYYLSALQSLAQQQPAKLEQLAVDLGDGTYLIQFQRSGQTSYVRVDGDLPSSGPYGGGLEYAHLGASGDQWVPIFEKAYAYYRTGASTYSSLDWGASRAAYNDLGLNATTISLPTSQTSFYTSVSASLAANKPVDIATNSTINPGVPLVQSHAYSVMAVTQDASGTVWVTLRNPWGFDGFNVDSNSGDGLVTISYATLKANANAATLVA